MMNFFTYLDISLRSLLLLLIQLLGGLFVGWVLKVGSEKSQMFLLLVGIFFLLDVKLLIFLLDLLFDEARIPNPDIVVGASGYLLTQVLETLGRSSQLPYLLNFEAFRLLFHIFEENSQVGRDSICAFKVFDVVSSIQFLAQVLAHSFDIYDCLGELDIGFTRIFEANWSKNFKFLILIPQVSLFVLFFNIN